jgi:hypothetical protein
MSRGRQSDFMLRWSVKCNKSYGSLGCFKPHQTGGVDQLDILNSVRLFYYQITK